MSSAESKIRVKSKGIPLAPFSFQFEKKKHVINNILHNWQEYGYDPEEVKKDWAAARRRDYFHVETKEGRVFEIFHDMGSVSDGQWFLTREIVDAK